MLLYLLSENIMKGSQEQEDYGLRLYPPILHKSVYKEELDQFSPEAIYRVIIPP